MLVGGYRDSQKNHDRSKQYDSDDITLFSDRNRVLEAKLCRNLELQKKDQTFNTTELLLSVSVLVGGYQDSRTDHDQSKQYDPDDITLFSDRNRVLEAKL